MSSGPTATTEPAGSSSGPAAPGGAPTDACPLCGAPLSPQQSWCLSCGAAARTRLAPAPNWRTPLIALAIVVILSAAGITAALVALTGSSTTTVTSGATPPAGATPAAATPPPAGATPAAAAPAVGATAGAAAPTGATSATGAATILRRHRHRRRRPTPTR